MAELTVPIERTREAWRCAARFSPDKEKVYPDHAAAHEFDAYSGKAVLEYGCGGGSDAMSWLRRGNFVTFVDVVAFNVGVARDRIAAAGLSERSVPLALEDSAPLPLPDASFDVVNCHGVLHHIVDPLPVAREFFRVLRVGGVAYVMLYTEQLRARLDDQVTRFATWKGVSEAEAFCAFTDEPGCPYARPYSDAEGRELLESAGFRVVKSTLYNADDFRTFKAVKEHS